MILDLYFLLLLLCGIYHGPRCKWFVKHGIADFGDFLVILLIQAKVNAASYYEKYRGRLPKRSIVNIQTFLQIFQLLTTHQRDILAKFILNDDVDGFFREHFGDDWQKIVDKYEHTFRFILPALFQNGLAVSPNYRGGYACSTAKWVVIKTIFWVMERNTRRLDPKASTVSQNIAHAIAIMRDYRHNLVFQLYLQTIIHMQLTKDPRCFDIAEDYFCDIKTTNRSHYDAWLEFIADFRKRTHIPIGKSPYDWNSGFISWIMNCFETYPNLMEYIAEN